MDAVSPVHLACRIAARTVRDVEVPLRAEREAVTLLPQRPPAQGARGPRRVIVTSGTRAVTPLPSRDRGGPVGGSGNLSVTPPSCQPLRIRLRPDHPGRARGHHGEQAEA